MKHPVLISALAAALVVAAPSTAGAAPPAASMVAGPLAEARHADGYLMLAEHRRRRDCLGWAGVNRALHQRFHRVRLRRSVHNRRGEKIYIVRVRNIRGRYYRVRYNACARRITEVKRLRRIFCRNGRRLRSCLGRRMRKRR